MAAFEYTAIVNETGKKKKGLIEADSERNVRQKLREQDLFPLEVKQTKEKKNANRGFLASLLDPSLTTDELSMFTRQLSTLIASSLPLEECLVALVEQAETTKERRIFSAVRSKVLEGHTLSQGLQEFPRAFSKLYCSTVSAGEHSGNLALVLNNLADYMENQQSIEKKLKSAAIYPTILVTVAIGITVGLMVLVVPTITGIFDSVNAELPGPTKVVIAISDWIRQYGILAFFGLIADFILFKVWNSKPNRLEKTHRFYLKLPLIKKMSKGFNASRYIGTLAILTKAGVPLVEAMRIAKDVVQNIPIQKSLIKAMTSVSEGGTLHQALRDTGYFRPMMLHMIQSGEASGELAQMLQRTSSSEESQLKNLIDSMISLISPLMILLIGGVVLIIVLAIVLPITSMSSVL
ncbi:MAG: type II secretion system inner membrane protein GspF [Saccharospirillaceae bacterium]|nr:type II secretion system inner membrane protein GspF [Pseudomonadales bacterium]NRB80532.1 type II secretion system inner membrane protein GspF [Saccharospirillaceae bacterium]